MIMTEAQRKEKVDESFDRLLQEPMVKMGISLMPSPEQHPDLLVSLLRSAFDQGVGVGSASAMIEVLGAIMSKEPK